MSPLTVQDVEDPRFQRREWNMQRVWWSVLAVLVLAALLGLFGTGPLSETTAGGSSAGVQVSYERFVRHLGRTVWTIRLEPSAVQHHQATVFISDELAQAMQVENITPAPTTETATRGGLLLQYDVPRPESPPVLRLLFRPSALGVQNGVIRAGNTDGVSLWLLFYP